MLLHPIAGAALQGVLSDIPHDAPAIVAYIVLALFVAFAVIGGRSKSGAQDSSTTPSEAPSPSGETEPSVKR